LPCVGLFCYFDEISLWTNLREFLHVLVFCLLCVAFISSNNASNLTPRVDLCHLCSPFKFLYYWVYVIFVRSNKIQICVCRQIWISQPGLTWLSLQEDKMQSSMRWLYVEYYHAGASWYCFSQFYVENIWEEEIFSRKDILGTSSSFQC
jgi:hypothetical protein